MALLSACIGAKGFESDTYFEMALRDAQLIPGLEGSAHINLGLAAEFIGAYFANFDRGAVVPKSLFAGEAAAAENPYLMEASTTHINTIRFGRYFEAYRPLMPIPGVRMFAKQAAAFALFIRRTKLRGVLLADPETALALGGCLAAIAYGQLIAENCTSLDVAPAMISTIFDILVQDLSVAALNVATLPELDKGERIRIRRLIVVPPVRGASWDVVADRASVAAG
jgi:acyl-CoA dehydrogenase